eukprot:gene4771-6693_t
MCYLLKFLLFLIFIIQIYVNGIDSTPAVVDLILYNGEPFGLYRLQYLKDVVDLFIVIESAITFTNSTKKEIYLKKSEPILDELRQKKKIVEIILTDLPNLNGNLNKYDSNWNREKYLRNLGKEKCLEIMKGRKFVLIVTDADELPRKEYVAKFPEMYNLIGTGMRLIMINIYYSFKWTLLSGKSENKWYFPYIITDEGTRIRNESLDSMRVTTKYMASMTHIWGAGWHCTFCMDATDIIRKIESFSHQELNKPQFKENKWVQTCIDKGKDLFQRPQVTVLPYMCNREGLPICSNCNLSYPAYELLKLDPQKPCAEKNSRKDFIHLEYRNPINGAREYPLVHQFPYILDYVGKGSPGTAPDPTQLNRMKKSNHVILRSMNITNLIE